MSVFEANPRITPFLWFATEAKQAAEFYTSVFPNSRILKITSSEALPNAASAILTVDFELDGQRFIALNTGQSRPFTEAISFAIRCNDQAEVDHYWDKLTEGGAEIQCGWLKDRFGLFWQVTPAILPRLIRDPKGMQAMMRMKKIDIAELERAVSE